MSTEFQLSATGFRFCAHWISDVLHRGGGGNLISNIITVIPARHQQLLLCLVRLSALVIGWTKNRLPFLSIFPLCVPSRYLLFVSCFSEISFICSMCPSCTPSIVKSPSVWAVCIWTRLCLLCGLSDQRWVWAWILSSLILTLLTTCTQCIQWDMGWVILVSFYIFEQCRLCMCDYYSITIIWPVILPLTFPACNTVECICAELYYYMQFSCSTLQILDHSKWT